MARRDAELSCARSLACAVQRRLYPDVRCNAQPTDDVTFNDAGSNSPNVNIQGLVQPSTVTVNNGTPNCSREIPRPVASNVGRIVPPRYPFVYQDWTNPKVADFRRRHGLDRVVADAIDEMDALVAVRDWTFNQFRAGPPTHWRLDADEILKSAPEGRAFHCTFYALVSVQAYTALGYIARRLNIDVAEADPKPFPHMIYDVWCNQLDQWVVMDSMSNIHFEMDAKPLSALEVRRAHLEGRGRGVDVVFGRGKERKILPKDPDRLRLLVRDWYQQRWNPPDDHWSHNILQMTDPRLYCFIGVYGGNDLFSRPISANHVKHYPVLIWYDDQNRDECWWIRPQREAEAYGIEAVARRVEEANDLEWPINRCELQASRGEQDELEVNVWTDTPNFSHFEYRHDTAQRWQRMDLTPNVADGFGVPRWVWDLKQRGSHLEVRSVNLRGIGGVVATMHVPPAVI